MNTPTAPSSRQQADKQQSRTRLATALLALATLTLAATPARAVDGCEVLLCFAAPDWRKIPQCVPTITKVLRDLARGKPFPSCTFGGSGNRAEHAWSQAPDNCPPQYTQTVEGPNGPIHFCDFVGAVSVTVNGALFSRTWWTMDGGTSTEFSASAKTQLGSWNARFDDDFAAWLHARPPVTPVDPTY